eukprot:9458502-Lingulodinium_polyedra.AAC.1
MLSTAGLASHRVPLGKARRDFIHFAITRTLRCFTVDRGIGAYRNCLGPKWLRTCVQCHCMLACAQSGPNKQ